MLNFLQLTLQGKQPDSSSGENPSGENQHLTWHWLADGVLLMVPHQETHQRVMLSAGVHGNETAPIEILCRHVDQLLSGNMPLSVRLLVVLGNISAMREGKRYHVVDLNRLFHGRHQNYPPCEETARAIELETLVADFFSETKDETDRESDDVRLHFDLHTAIRASHHLRFGVIPQLDQRTTQSGFLHQLCHMGLEALVLNSIPGGTFSFYTSAHLNVLSCTLELGKASPFGTNELTQFSAFDEGLFRLITGQVCSDSVTTTTIYSSLKIYRVAQELKKFSDDFYFPEIDTQVKNFTAFPQGTLIAKDGDVEYRVQHEREWLIFPNAGVRNGLRAGMMLEETSLEALGVNL